MIGEQYKIVFNKMRDMLTQNFLALPEVEMPVALMIGNSTAQHIMEMNIYNDETKQNLSVKEMHEDDFFETFSRLTAFRMRADFVLSYQEIWTVPGMLVEGATLQQIEKVSESYGGIEKNPGAMEVLLISIETLDGERHTEMCPILPNRTLKEWEQLRHYVPMDLRDVLEICRDPKLHDKYQAYYERLTNCSPIAAEMN